MHVFRDLSHVPDDFGDTVVSIGNFDGVHLAHQRVIKSMRARAAESQARSLAITFDPHPTRVLRPHNASALITPLAYKLDLLAAAGLDATLVLPFTRRMISTGSH